MAATDINKQARDSVFRERKLSGFRLDFYFQSFFTDCQKCCGGGDFLGLFSGGLGFRFELGVNLAQPVDLLYCASSSNS